MMVDEPSLESEGLLHLLDIKQKSDIFPPVKTPYQSIRLSPDGNRILIRTSENTLDLYDRTGAQSKIPVTLPRTFGKVAFSSDGRYLAVTDDQQMYIIDTTTGATQRQLPTQLSVSSVVFTPDNKFLLVSSVGAFINREDPFADTTSKTNAIEVWSVADGHKVDFKLNEKDVVEAVAMGNDRIAISQNQKIRIFNLNDAAIVKEFEYGPELASLSISPNGKFIVTCDSKGFIELWETDSGTSKGKTFIGSFAERLVFDADGASLIAITAHWIHQIKILTDSSETADAALKPNSKLEYAKGIFTGEIDRGSVRLLTADANQAGTSPVKYFRWLRDGVDDVELVEGSFDGQRSNKILTGDSDKLLMNWQAKLGFNVTPSGILEADTPNRHWYASR
jgi:WD40 repeat protein